MAARVTPRGVRESEEGEADAEVEPAGSADAGRAVGRAGGGVGVAVRLTGVRDDREADDV